MKRHLNTLFVTTQGAWLSKDGECIVLSLEGRELGRIPIHTLGALVCFGRVICSPFLLDHCAQNGDLNTPFSSTQTILASLGFVVGTRILHFLQEIGRAHV